MVEIRLDKREVGTLALADEKNVYIAFFFLSFNLNELE